jgi:prophage regulatory protein
MLNNDLQLLRRNEVIRLTARSRSALLIDEKEGLFCPPISIGYRAVAYVKYEVDEIIKARIQGKTNQQIKSIVTDLLSQRQS